jgi:ATP-dependent DNA helicase RecG
MVLVSDTKGADAQSRLRAIKETSDGFKIAEYDLELRGPGDFIGSSSGIRQHGEVGLRLAATCRDTALIERAAYYARRTAEADPELKKTENIATSCRLADYVSKAEKISN